MTNIELTISQLQDMLDDQKTKTAEYITRNLTVYSWYGNGNKVDLDTAKNELQKEVKKSGYPDEFNILKKYIK